MKVKHIDLNNNVYEYDENIWTGKKTLKLNGELITKVGRNQYQIKEQLYTLKGNLFTSITLINQNDKIVLVDKLEWFEYVLAVLPFIVAIIGGLIGGIFGGLACVVNLVVMRSKSNILIKVGSSLLLTGVAFLMWYIVASVLLNAQ